MEPTAIDNLQAAQNERFTTSTMEAFNAGMSEETQRILQDKQKKVDANRDAKRSGSFDDPRLNPKLLQHDVDVLREKIQRLKQDDYKERVKADTYYKKADDAFKQFESAMSTKEYDKAAKARDNTQSLVSKVTKMYNEAVEIIS